MPGPVEDMQACVRGGSGPLALCEREEGVAVAPPDEDGHGEAFERSGHIQASSLHERVAGTLDDYAAMFHHWLERTGRLNVPPAERAT